MAETTVFGQTLGFYYPWAHHSQKVSIVRRKRNKSFLLNFVEKMRKKFDLPKMRKKYIDLSTALIILENTGSFPVFWYEFLSQFYFLWVEKKLFYSKITSTGTYPSVITALREYQKAQLVLNFLDVATHFSSKIRLFHVVLNRKPSVCTRVFHWKWLVLFLAFESWWSFVRKHVPLVFEESRFSYFLHLHNYWLDFFHQGVSIESFRLVTILFIEKLSIQFPASNPW